MLIAALCLAVAFFTLVALYFHIEGREPEGRDAEWKKFNKPDAQILEFPSPDVTRLDSADVSKALRNQKPVRRADVIRLPVRGDK